MDLSIALQKQCGLSKRFVKEHACTGPSSADVAHQNPSPDGVETGHARLKLMN
jgi:hypothetical protein